MVALTCMGQAHFRSAHLRLASTGSAPTSISTLGPFLWIDALATITNANNTTLGSGQILDQSTNAWGFNISGSPYYFTSGGATNQPYLICTNGGGFNMSAGTFTNQHFTVSMVVAMLRSGGGSGNPFWGNNGAGVGANSTSATFGDIDLYNGTHLLGSANAFITNVWLQITWLVDGSNSFIRTNGVVYASGNCGLNSGLENTWGMVSVPYNGNYYINCAFERIAMWNSVLNSNTVRELELKNKNDFGLPGLP